MTYYVYENWTHDRARVHKADCAYCNYGRGVGTSTGERNGRWLGPYVDRGKAFRYIRDIGREDSEGCRICKP